MNRNQMIWLHTYIIFICTYVHIYIVIHMYVSTYIYIHMYDYIFKKCMYNLHMLCVHLKLYRCMTCVYVLSVNNHNYTMFLSIIVYMILSLSLSKYPVSYWHMAGALGVVGMTTVSSHKLGFCGGPKITRVKYVHLVHWNCTSKDMTWYDIISWWFPAFGHCVTCGKNLRMVPKSLTLTNPK